MWNLTQIEIITTKWRPSKARVLTFLMLETELNLHSQLNTWLQWIGQRQRQDKMRNISVLGFQSFGATYIRGLMV